MTVRPRDDLALRAGYHSPQLDVAVRLNTNESPDGPPAAWERALIDEVLPSVDWNRYPDRGAHALRAAIAELHGVAPAQVFPANGSNEVLQTLLLTYGGPGRRALLWEPTYALHSHLARITGTEVVAGERGADFALDVDTVLADLAAHEPSIVFLCSPNNPTGVVDDRSLVEAVVADASARDALVVMDEAYGQFAPWSAVELVADDAPLVVVRTFSKTWAMAAARLGYCVAPEAIVAALDEVVLPYHLDAFKQAAGVAALRFGDDMAARVERLVAERERLIGRLRAAGVEVWPSGANFILFRPPADGRAVWQGLVDRSVLVRDCSSWPRLDGCLRVTIGTPDEDDRFIEALEEVLA
ncbi:MAG: histidinol-phosphate transaminase [Acidimicrobiales bacterium]|nr:histidinol-phosphate transaminase [Acidimicrobiales bacterium]